MINAQDIYFLDANIINHHMKIFQEKYKVNSVMIPQTVLYEICRQCRGDDDIKCGANKFLNIMNSIFNVNGIYFMPDSLLHRLLQSKISYSNFYNKLEAEQIKNLTIITSNFVCIYFQYLLDKNKIRLNLSDDDFSKLSYERFYSYIKKIIEDDLNSLTSYKDYLNKELFNKLFVIFTKALNIWLKNIAARYDKICEDDFNELLKILFSQTFQDNETVDISEFVKQININSIDFTKNKFLNIQLIKNFKSNLTNKEKNRIEINDFFDYMIADEFLNFVDAIKGSDVNAYFLTNDKNFILFKSIKILDKNSNYYTAINSSIKLSKNLIDGEYK